MTKTLRTSFAKLFELPEKRQLVAYVDPNKEDPKIVFVSEAFGVTASTIMRVGSKEGSAPLESQRAAMAALLDLIDDSKARELFSILEGTLNKHIPHLKILEELSEMAGQAGQARQPFARIVEGPSGEGVLLIRGIDDGIPYLQAITREERSTHPLSVEQRDEFFLKNPKLSEILPSTILNHLGISSPEPSTRKLGM